VRRQLLNMRLVIVVVAVWLALAPVQHAVADEQRGFQEPGIPYLEEDDPWIEMGLGALIVVACLLIAFKNPHRGHAG